MRSSTLPQSRIDDKPSASWLDTQIILVLKLTHRPGTTVVAIGTLLHCARPTHSFANDALADLANDSILGGDYLHLVIVVTSFGFRTDLFTPSLPYVVVRIVNTCLDVRNFMEDRVSDFRQVV